MSKHFIEFCQGSGEGRAIYISDDTGGFRAFGPKCWGFIKTIAKFELTENNIDRAIEELKKAKRKIRAEKRKEDQLAAKNG